MTGSKWEIQGYKACKDPVEYPSWTWTFLWRSLFIFYCTKLWVKILFLSNTFIICYIYRFMTLVKITVYPFTCPNYLEIPIYVSWDEFRTQPFDGLGIYGWIYKTCALPVSMSDIKFKNMFSQKRQHIFYDHSFQIRHIANFASIPEIILHRWVSEPSRRPRLSLLNKRPFKTRLTRRTRRNIRINHGISQVDGKVYLSTYIWTT